MFYQWTESLLELHCQCIPEICIYNTCKGSYTLALVCSSISVFSLF